MTEHAAVRKHEEIHGVAERGVADDLLPLRLGEIVAMRRDTTDPAWCWWAIKRNGAGIRQWHGQRPSAALDEFCRGLARELAGGVAHATGGAWIVAATDWHPLRHDGPCFDRLVLVWCDRDGDKPFTVEVEVGNVGNLLARAHGLAETAFHAWVRYAEQLEEAGIRAEHTSRIAQGEAAPSPVSH